MAINCLLAPTLRGIPAIIGQVIQWMGQLEGTGFHNISWLGEATSVKSCGGGCCLSKQTKDHRRRNIILVGSRID